jgi:hypothetical protein
MIRLSEDTRRALADAKAKVREIMRPELEAQKIARKQARRTREKAVQGAPGQREPRDTDAAFLAYLRRQPCEAAGLGGCSGPIEAAHIRYSEAGRGRNPGLQRKNHDRHANPLCRFHHQHDQHKGAERAFWARLGKDAYATAERHYAAFLAGRPFPGGKHKEQP